MICTWPGKIIFFFSLICYDYWWIIFSRLIPCSRLFFLLPSVCSTSKQARASDADSWENVRSCSRLHFFKASLSLPIFGIWFFGVCKNTWRFATVTISNIYCDKNKCPRKKYRNLSFVAIFGVLWFCLRVLKTIVFDECF